MLFRLVSYCTLQTNKHKSKMSFIQNLSVYIPRIHRDDANSEFIARTFYEQEIASVRRVDFNKCHDKGTGTDAGRVYYQAKIYFHFWFKNQIAYNIQRRIVDGTHARVVYADPWYWILLENKNPLTELELVVNERLDALAANAVRTSWQAAQINWQTEQINLQMQQIAQLQEAVQANTEQLKKRVIQPNTHIRFCYPDEEPTAACANADAEKTATECAEQVLYEPVTEPVTDDDEWDDYYDEVDRYYHEQTQHEQTLWAVPISSWNRLPTSLRERNCEGCYLLDQGTGGENQEGHSCLEGDFEIM